MNKSPTRNMIIGFDNFGPLSHEDADEHTIAILLDIDCKKSHNFLQQLDHRLYMNYRFFIINNLTQVDKIFHDLPILVSSEIFYVIPEMNDGILKMNQTQPTNSNFIINQIYRTRVEEPLRHEVFGKWNDLVGFKRIDRRDEVTSRRRRNLNKTTIHASLVVTDNDTLHHLADYQNKQIDTITKVNYLLTNYVGEILNADINYSYVSTWGYLNPNTSSWNGMIGELIEGRADVGASPLFFTIDRIPIIEYIILTSKTRSKFVFRSPKLSYTENVFILPFDHLVWCSFIGLCLILSFSLFITIFTEWKQSNKRKMRQDDNSIMRASFGDSMLLVFSAACQQGSASEPKSFTARQIMFLTYLTLMFIYTSYSANIVALLQSPSTKIKTLIDLYNSRLKFGVHNTVFNQYYFSHAEEITRKRIYKEKVIRKDGFSNFMTLEDGVNSIRGGLFAFHMELGVGYKLISETFLEYEKCDLQEIQYLEVIDPYYAIQKNSSFNELFTISYVVLISLYRNKNLIDVLFQIASSQ